MLSVITRLRSLWGRLADRKYREAYLDEAINTGLSAQIYALRMSRGLTQAEVASRAGMAQPTLSRLESDAHGVTTTTLKRLANTYDVALSVRFVSYKELAEDIAVGKVDRYIPSFVQDATPKELAIAARITAPSTYQKPITINHEYTTLAGGRTSNTFPMTRVAEDRKNVRAS